MIITLNGQQKEFEEEIPLCKIIENFCRNTNRVIAEVNGDIIKKDMWPITKIKSGDTIELVTFVGGG